MHETGFLITYIRKLDRSQILNARRYEALVQSASGGDLAPSLGGRKKISRTKIS